MALNPVGITVVCPCETPAASPCPQALAASLLLPVPMALTDHSGHLIEWVRWHLSSPLQGCTLPGPSVSLWQRSLVLTPLARGPPPLSPNCILMQPARSVSLTCAHLQASRDLLSLCRCDRCYPACTQLPVSTVRLWELLCRGFVPCLPGGAPGHQQGMGQALFLQALTASSWLRGKQALEGSSPSAVLSDVISFSGSGPQAFRSPGTQKAQPPAW